MQKSLKYAAALLASVTLPALAAQTPAPDNAGQQNAQQNTSQESTGQENTGQTARRNNLPQGAEQQNAEQQNAEQQNAGQQNAEQQNTEQQNAEQQNGNQQNASQQNAGQQNASQETAEQKRADRDFGKLSTVGNNALRDIRLVRLEIFNGHINRAKADIAKAVSLLDKAKSDDTVFMKAESDLKQPPGTQASGQSTSTPSTTPIAWLPVDGAMTLGEDYVASPANAATLAKANAKLSKGDRQGAMNDLKLAGLDVNFLVELAPLQATIAGVNQASNELNQGKYYEANQTLKSVEDGMRFDSESLIATPQAHGAEHGKPNG